MYSDEKICVILGQWISKYATDWPGSEWWYERVGWISTK